VSELRGGVAELARDLYWFVLRCCEWGVVLGDGRVVRSVEVADVAPVEPEEDIREVACRIEAWLRNLEEKQGV